MALDSYILDNGELNDLNVSFKDVLNPQCRVQFTDNVSSINVLSTTGRDDLLYANIGSNVQEIQASCFTNQSQLQAVTGSATSLLKVGDAAFKDCTALTSISFIDNAHGLNFIGASAFMNTGLEKAKVYMTALIIDSTGYAPEMDAYAFANNTQLKEVEIVGGNFLGDYEFAGCTALTAVKMPNRHSFSGRYSFKDCSSLANVTIPASTYELNVGLFEGCSSLTSITFNEPSELHFARCLQNNFLNGTAITSLTLPASITAYAFINNYAFANMPLLKQIKFNGLRRDQIALSTQNEDVGVHTGIIYSSAYDYGLSLDPTYFEKTNSSNCLEKQNICLQNGIPFIFIGLMEGCPNCERFATKIIRSTQFLNWVKSKNNKYVIIETYGGKKISQLKFGNNKMARAGVFWRHIFVDGTHTDVQKTFSSVSSRRPWQTPEDFISFIENSEIAAYDGSGTATEVISADIYNTNCFGLNHDVMLFGNDSELPVPFEYKGDGELPSIIFEQSIYTDKRTINDFKYGQWYYNAKELKEYADKYHLPVLLELGSIKCGPCTDFQTFVFMNPDFQELLTKSYQILLCRLGEEAQFTTGQPAYVMQQWFNAIWTTELHSRMPILMFYWKQSEEKTHYVYAHFNSEADESFPNLPLVYNYESVKEWLETKCFPLLNTEPAYTPSAQFNMPEVFELSALRAYPRYKMYANQNDDDYGRYFPTVRLEPVVHGLDDFYTISVQNAEGVLTQYSIDSTKTTGLPPQGTYQYFTSLSNADTLSSWYEANYDISGIIFKVGQNNTFANMPNKTLTCLPGVCALTAYLDNVGLSGSTIVSQISAFNAEIYVYDGENGWSTSISPDFRPIYNAKLTYMVNGLDAAELTGIAKVEVYASADVEINEIGQIGFKQDAQLSVLSACYYVPTSTTAKVVWLSTFYNFEESIV